MAETREEGRRREHVAQPRETEAQLHALMQASARIRLEATPPKLLTVRVPKGTATTHTACDAPLRQPREAHAPRQVAQAQEQVLAQARQTLRALIAAYGAAVVWQEVVAPVYAAHSPVPTSSAPAPANAMPLSTQELSQVFGVTVVEQP
jgi:hypothetical protein